MIVVTIERDDTEDDRKLIGRVLSAINGSETRKLSRSGLIKLRVTKRKTGSKP
jgi:hypothetical protein